MSLPIAGALPCGGSSYAAAMSLAAVVVLMAFVAPPPARPPEPSSNLVLAGPIARWDEAIPLGNGLLGGLIWGGAVGADGVLSVNLSLDRGDLWDLRLPDMLKRDDWTWETIQRLHREGADARIREMFDVPYDTVPYPTKIPGGRLVLQWDDQTAGANAISSFELDLATAECRSMCNGRPFLRAFFDATAPIAMLRCDDAARMTVVRPSGLDTLSYAPGQVGSNGEMTWLVQEAAMGLPYAIVAGQRQRDGHSEIAIAIASTNDDPDPLALAQRRVTEALSRGYDELRGPHADWWRKFWLTSRISIPEPRLQKHYDLVKYLYGAGSRRDAPPMPLQGVWTADEGGLPPWKGDFHNDLNTQTTYIAYPTAGLWECGESFLDFNWKLLPKYRDFAQRFYGLEHGAVVPGVMALDGSALGGWCQYSLSPTNGAWIAQAFYLHWRYTMDDRFLRERALPWCSEIGDALFALMKEDERGKLMLPLSSSPEIFDNSPRAFLPPNSHYDLSLVAWLFSALASMNQVIGDEHAAAQWLERYAQLDLPDVDEQGGLTFARGIPYRESHRHFSHAMAIHPLGWVTIEGGDRERAVIDATLDALKAHGTQAWCGYSFSWFACMLARCGRGDEALRYLRDYERAFTLRNGFHANGDQTKSGLSGFTYRPFTLEGNMLAMQAIHEMLLQSWGGVVRIFPAMPEEWRDAEFEDLRAEGGFRVWANRERGLTRRVEVVATVDGTLTLRNPFGPGAQARWNRRGMIPDDKGDYVLFLRAGETVVGERQ